MKNYSSLNGKECPQRWVMEYKAARLVALALKTDRSGKKAELKKCRLIEFIGWKQIGIKL